VEESGVFRGGTGKERRKADIFSNNKLFAESMSRDEKRRRRRLVTKATDQKATRRRDFEPAAGRRCEKQGVGRESNKRDLRGEAIATKSEASQPELRTIKKKNSENSRLGEKKHIGYVA